ncbi:hypothetical protein J2T18_000015 [Paenibacillus polymyxa]|nr:hypothetical protein [Paenibacillus polymyxa]
MTASNAIGKTTNTYTFAIAQSPGEEMLTSKKENTAWPEVQGSGLYELLLGNLSHCMNSFTR